MTELSEAVKWSLTNAGIGKRFHDSTLADDKVYGEGLKKFLTDHGEDIRAGQSVVFQGVHLYEGVMLLARGLHIHGVGCRVLPLVHMRKVIMDPDLREEVDDCQVLMLMQAQTDNRGAPLSDSFMDETEYFIRKRFEEDKSTILLIEVPVTMDWRTLKNCYWSAGFREWTKTTFLNVKEGDLK